MPAETATAEKAASIEANANGGAQLPWEGFMETVSKYGRNAERHLFVYGISVSRCASCRLRLKEDAHHCEQCGQQVPIKYQACTCCKTPKPVIWCYECDFYYCEPCHRKPHGLRFGNEKQGPHHCYAIDGSSGKLLRYGSFSDTLKAMTKAARRSQMKFRQDKPSAEVKPTTEAKPTMEAEAQAVTASNAETLRAEEKTAREKKVVAKETAPPAMQRPLAHPASAAPSAPGSIDLASLSSNIAAMRESRKRKAPTVDLTNASSQPPPPQQSSATAHPPAATATTAQPDGKSLYDQLKHRFSAGGIPTPDTRIKSEAAAAAAATTPTPREPVSTPSSRPTGIVTATSVAPSPTESAPASRIVSMSQPPPHPMSAMPAPSQNHASRPSPTSLPPRQPAQPAQSFGLPPASGSRMPSPMNHSVPSPSSASLSSAALSSDPLKGAVVERYDRVNKQIAAIEDKLKKLSDLVRRASSSDQNVVQAAQISQHMVQYRAELLASEEERYQALANVILFSSDMRAFASSLSPQQVGDIPHVLTGCHAKCAHLAEAIEELQTKQKTLRDTIDAAVNSGDVTQLLRLQSFSAEIEAIDTQMQQTRKDRDGQFQLMYQFSKRLRDAVAAQHAALSRPT